MTGKGEGERDADAGWISVDEVAKMARKTRIAVYNLAKRDRESGLRAGDGDAWVVRRAWVEALRERESGEWTA